MMNLDYAFTRNFPGVTPEAARARIEASLKEEGFGILTEIDVKATLKKKLDVEFRKYWILGACNPRVAHEALTMEPGIGLLLPCNVVVTEDTEGNAVVSIMDPQAMVRAIPNNEHLRRPMEQVREMVKRALEKA
jgi:uncharacterized protein (DUF302 family)